MEEALSIQTRQRGSLVPEVKREAPTTRGYILVAEDDPQVREVLGSLLELQGYAFKIVADGEEALKAFQEAPYDCLITDWEMPRRNGLDLARAVKVLNPLVPVILCTGSLDQDSYEQLAKEGLLDGYLPKPFRAQSVVAAIEKALGYERWDT